MSYLPVKLVFKDNSFKILYLCKRDGETFFSCINKMWVSVRNDMNRESAEYYINSDFIKEISQC